MKKCRRDNSSGDSCAERSQAECCIKCIIVSYNLITPMTLITCLFITAEDISSPSLDEMDSGMSEPPTVISAARASPGSERGFGSFTIAGQMSKVSPVAPPGSSSRSPSSSSLNLPLFIHSSLFLLPVISMLSLPICSLLSSHNLPFHFLFSALITFPVRFKVISLPSRLHIDLSR